MKSITETVTLEIVTCANCGTPFGVEHTLNRTLRSEGRSFYCPNGHRQYYPGETDEQKIKRLEKELKNEKEGRAFFQEQAEEKARELGYTRKALSSTRGQLTKTKKRIQGGACPCCNRQFTNLSRHMATKHPQYAEADNGSEAENKNA